MKVRRLEPGDDRSAFRSGNAELDRFFLRYAGQEQLLQQIGTTYVAVDDAGRVRGFATVMPSEIAGPPGSKKSPLPILRLARLDVDRRARGKGVGRKLLSAALGLALRLAQNVGCEGLVVDARRGEVSFFSHLGFVELDGAPEGVTMFLELGSVPVG
jgi:GNAT superfamily N-acetyltransferase